MSVVLLAQVKADLRMTHSADDDLLQTLINASEDEALRFLNRSELPTIPYDLPTALDPEVTATQGNLAPSIYAAVFLLVRAKYEAKDASEIQALRLCAETLMQPYRTGVGL